ELEKIKVQNKKKDTNVGPLVDRLVQLCDNFVSYTSAIISKGVADVDMSSAELPREIDNAVFVIALTAYLTEDKKHADLAASRQTWHSCNHSFRQRRFQSALIHNCDHCVFKRIAMALGMPCRCSNMSCLCPIG
ncbi:hypothetical protein VP01_13653g1, partial [Puccinia sorghi]